MVVKIIAFSLALIPFLVWQGYGDGIRTPKEIASIISLTLLVILGIPKEKPFNRYFFIFLGWCVVTLILSNYGLPLYIGQNQNLIIPSPIIAFKSLFYILISLLAIQVISNTKIDFKLIAKVISWVCIVMCIYGFIQIAGFDEWFKTYEIQTGWTGKSIWENPSQAGHYSRRLVGTLGNPSILGMFLAICLPICFYLKDKLGKTAFILSSVVILLTLSLTSYIASVISFIFIIFFRSKKLALSLLAVLIILGATLFYLPQTKFLFNPTGRIGVLKESFNLINKKAVTGYGLGSFEYLIGLNPDVSKKLENQNWREAHNEYWQAWFETGIVGLMLLLLGLFTTLRTFLKNKTKETICLAASFTAFLIFCLTYFPLRVPPVSYYGIIILGLLSNKTDLLSNKTGELK